MKKFLHSILITFILIVNLYAFSASYTYDNIDNLAYVVAIGIDTSKSNNLKISFQFTDTSAYSNDSSSGSKGTIINTVEAQSLESSVNILNSYIGKNVNLAHCKVIVFSEEIAKAGLSNYIYSLINNSQIRPTSNIVISKCEAKYYLENSISESEKLITKYYDVFPNSSDYTGYISYVTLGDFFNQITDKTRSPVAILGGVNAKTSDINSGSEDASSILASKSTVVGERGTENLGLAVFKEDKLVGELTALESLCHSIIDNEANTFLISIANPRNSENTIDLSASEYKKTSINVDVSNGSPYINIDVYLNAEIMSIDTNTDYLDEAYLNEVATSANNFLASQISKYLYKTSTDFKSCINDFDKYASIHFLTNNDWENYDWVSSYEDAFFNVNVYTSVNSSMLLTES
ncbi:MAG: hypothetical protein IKF17_05870 [Clostridia bacterium]|nr:hypothetical protein [Clostridia bacterium]